MTQEEKELLLKDLCSRLPYGVKVQSYSYDDDVETIETLRAIDFDGYISTLECETLKNIYKPYLFPMSSMTEEQLYEVSQILGKNVAIFTDYLLTIDHRRRTFSYQELDALFNWFDKNHFDYRGLIPMGLANDATGLDIY